MSLLQDALKRQQEEQAGKQPSASMPPPPDPIKDQPPRIAMDTPPSQTLKSTRSKEWVAGIVMLAGFVLLIAIVGFVYLLLQPKSDSSPDVSPQTVLAEDIAEPPVSMESEAVETAEQPLQRETPATMLTDPEKEILVEEPIVLTDEEVVTPTTINAESTEPMPDNDTTLLWPDIRVQAAMGMGSTGTVLINGSIYHVGELYKGVRIVEITNRGIRMEYQGEERLILVRR